MGNYRVRERHHQTHQLLYIRCEENGCDIALLRVDRYICKILVMDKRQYNQAGLKQHAPVVVVSGLVVVTVVAVEVVVLSGLVVVAVVPVVVSALVVVTVEALVEVELSGLVVVTVVPVVLVDDSGLVVVTVVPVVLVTDSERVFPP